MRVLVASPFLPKNIPPGRLPSFTPWCNGSFPSGASIFFKNIAPLFIFCLGKVILSRRFFQTSVIHSGIANSECYARTIPVYRAEDCAKDDALRASRHRIMRFYSLWGRSFMLSRRNRSGCLGERLMIPLLNLSGIQGQFSSRIVLHLRRQKT